MKKRILAVLMCACLLLAFTPVSFAEEGDMTEPETAQTDETQEEQNEAAGAETEEPTFETVEPADIETVNEPEASVITEEDVIAEEQKEISAVEDITAEEAVTAEEWQMYENNTVEEVVESSPFAARIINNSSYNTYLNTVNSDAFNVLKNGTLTKFYPDKYPSNHIIIPDEVNGIEVKSIGQAAFINCDNIISIYMPNSITSIGGLAFSGCTSLSSITLSSSINTIENMTFGDCSSLTSITLPDSITRIDGFAFSFCNNLKSITIPSSVRSIGFYPFQGCSSLENVIFMGDAPIMSDNSSSSHLIKTQLLGELLPSNYVTYYQPGAEGFSNPWYGYPCTVEGMPIPSQVNTSSNTSNAGSANNSSSIANTDTEGSKNSNNEDNIIKGDLLRKGKPTLGSFSLLGQYLLKTKTLDDYQLKAADMNGDGKVSMADFALLGKKLLGL